MTALDTCKICGNPWCKGHEEDEDLKYPKLIGAIHLIALLGSKKYQICEKEEAEYFANVKFWDKDNEELRGDFQVFIKSNLPNPLDQV